jgi:ribulose-phosphate 3-epimerase
MEIAPSILSVLDQNIIEISEKLEKIGIKYLHLDVMDNLFVPNKTFDDQFIKRIRPFSNLIFDTHLMIIEPEKYIDNYLDAGSDILTFHVEATIHSKEIIDKIKSRKKKVGISIKPKTPIHSIVEYLKKVDLVLIMSVEPGFGGQSFMNDVLEKVEYLKKYKEVHQLSYIIEIDGGINNRTIALAKQSGVELAVVGTYFFKKENMEATLKELTSI